MDSAGNSFKRAWLSARTVRQKPNGTKLASRSVQIVPSLVPRANHQNQASEIQAALVSRIVEATTRVSAANRKSTAVLNQIPTGLPHPDVWNSAHPQSIARTGCRLRKDMMAAHTRLNEFNERGIVPEDCKRTAA